ncbi:MAG: hypothetical protein CVU44_20990 [Chloroflexi bacterium HGW-Chloroflexi-6]|nr:MAG: hypothetical protein CVU44_20990 [Chloroflexi bacterium HGW-Chloroflexi-6]
MPMQKPVFILGDEARQLALDLDLPEIEIENISEEEARMRRETAWQALKALRSAKEPPAWLDDVFKLIEWGWTWRQAAYIAWCASPKIGRKPANQEDLATDYLGLSSDRAISTWRKRNPAIEDAIGLLQAAPLWESRADDFRALAEGAAKAGDDYKFFPHLKLKLEMRGDYVPKSELEALLKRKSASGAEVMSIEELERQAGYEENSNGGDE